MSHSFERRRESQRGYALLMVFLMAAMVALMLYQQLPRVAFETEREKEQLLIDRGEQYVRAIQLYYVANNRQWPTSIEDLEKREKRFLRRRYIDPYTGKDEWRIIHTTGGLLTDSLVTKPVGSSDSKSQSADNSTPAEGPPQVNAAVLQRPSDRPLTPPTGFLPPTQNQDGSTQNANGPLPPITLQPQQGQGALPPITIQQGAGNQGLPPITLLTGIPGGPQGQNTSQSPGQGQLNQGQINGQMMPGQGAFPGQSSPGGLPGGIQTGVPPGFRIDPSGQLVPITPVPNQGITGPAAFPNPPVNQPVTQAGQQGAVQGSPNAALNAINQILTTPARTTTTAAATNNNQIGAIAGIASTHKGPSIKLYKDQNQYEKWEFVFTPTASTLPGAASPGGQGGTQNGRGGSNPAGSQQSNGFGGGTNTFAPTGTFGPNGANSGGGRGGQPSGNPSNTPFGR